MTDRADWRANATVAVASARAKMLALARAYFANQMVMEVTTPHLCAAPVTDTYIDSMRTRVASRTAYLRTSPEYAMKRMLASGYPDIYEIGTVFRNGEVGHRHQPEFTMIEWYRHKYDLQAIIDDTIALITALLDTDDSVMHRQLQETKQLTYDAALRLATGLDSESSCRSLAAELAPDAAQRFGDHKDAILNILFDDKVVRSFEDKALTVITHYPKSQAALARICPTSQRALRFEVFCGDTELANGFVELTDADEQRARFEADLQRRQQNGLDTCPIDTVFLAALKAGLPDCAGVAVGFERLLMLATGHRDIRSVVSFAH